QRWRTHRSNMELLIRVAVPAPPKFPMNPKILLPHDERPDSGREGQGQDCPDGHVTGGPGDPANAEVGGHDGGEEDDPQHQPAVEPSLDQEPFQRVVSEASPVLFAHDHSSQEGSRRLYGGPTPRYQLPAW